MLKSNKKYPIDCIYSIPNPNISGITKNDKLKINKRQILLKNVIFQIIIEIRNDKKKPKLTDFIRIDGKPETKARKEYLINKLKILYGKYDDDS